MVRLAAVLVVSHAASATPYALPGVSPVMTWLRLPASVRSASVTRLWNPVVPRRTCHLVTGTVVDRVSVPGSQLTVISPTPGPGTAWAVGSTGQVVQVLPPDVRLRLTC